MYILFLYETFLTLQIYCYLYIMAEIDKIEQTLIQSVTNKWLNSFLPIFRLEKMCFETEFYILSIMVSLFDESKLAFHMPKGPLFLSWVVKKLALWKNSLKIWNPAHFYVRLLQTRNIFDTSYLRAMYDTHISTNLLNLFIFIT